MKIILKKGKIHVIDDHVDDIGSFKDTTSNNDQSSINNLTLPDQSSIYNLTYPDRTATVKLSCSSSSSDADASGPNDKHALVTRTPEYQPSQKSLPLLRLPQELFDMITGYLDDAHIVVLALVNKELLARFMHWTTITGLRDPDDPPSYRYLDRFLKLQSSPGMSKSRARGVVLSLIDYDMDDVVYCYKCKKIHSPFVSFMDRAYAPHKATRCMDWTMDHHMPSRATRKMLRVVTKRRIHGVEYRPLMQQVNNTSTTYLKGVMAQVSLRMRYRDDELLLRRQQVVSSIDKNSLALWLFSQQLYPSTGTNSSTVPNQSLTTLPQVYPMCNHRAWYSEYMSLLYQLVLPLCKSHGNHDTHTLHTAACFSNEHYDVSKQEGHFIYERLKWLSSGAKANPMDTPTLLGDVLGCSRCTTDFSLDVISLPEPFGWGFILTTWLDLGTLDFSAKWDSHRDAKPGRECKRHISETYGDICRRFEDLESSRDYRPRISELDLERMQNYGWGQRAVQGKDKYITWTQSHSCNPMTGMIEDPDPLEEADY